MTDPVRELKTRAELLHRKVRAQEPAALARMRVLPELRRASNEELASIAATLQRRHCLAVVAAELGFAGWPHAQRVLGGEADVSDFGTLLCPKRCGAHINLWYARYDEAAAVREARAGYLLAYRRQYLVVDRYYIETLGLDPEDRDWKRMGFDWVRPKDPVARGRLYAKLVSQLPREAA